MSTANGNGSDPTETYRKAFLTAEAFTREAREAARSADQLRAESERLAALADSWSDRCEHYTEKARRAGASESGLLRSRMTPREKSDFISTYGPTVYAALPWK